MPLFLLKKGSIQQTCVCRANMLEESTEIVKKTCLHQHVSVMSVRISTACIAVSVTVLHQLNSITTAAATILVVAAPVAIAVADVAAVAIILAAVAIATMLPPLLH